MPRVNPEILRWARETAGLSLEEAARRISLRETQDRTGAERLALLEGGEGEVSSALLRRMAQQYRRPLLTFYLAAIPQPVDVGQDFRSLPDRGDPTNTLLAALLRDVKSRQSLIREAIEDDEDFRPVPFIGSRRQLDGVNVVAASIVKDIKFERDRFRQEQTVEAAFDYLRMCAEQAGVFVLLAGNLGSWQTAIDVNVFRGFAIADPVAPFVVINDQDAKSAWSFTLLHELAHLWLGVTGVSGATATPGIEQFCNDVAATILVDRAEIIALVDARATSIDAIADIIGEFAGARKISRSLVAYQLFRQERISQASWSALAERFRNEWIEMRSQQREAARESEGGPNYYVVRRHRIGPALIGFVGRGLVDGSITPTKAARMLGVKPMSVYPLVLPPSRSARVA
jgi:Zn-dependent peptidase ImmA (M78 family)